MRRRAGPSPRCPSRSTAPGRKFCTNTSARRTRSSRISRPRGFRRSSAIARLPRLPFTKKAPSPPRANGREAQQVAEARRLHLDHLGALVGEDHRGERAGEDRGAVDDADAIERSGHGTSSGGFEAMLPRLRRAGSRPGRAARRAPRRRAGGGAAARSPNARRRARSARGAGGPRCGSPRSRSAARGRRGARGRRC